MVVEILGWFVRQQMLTLHCLFISIQGHLGILLAYLLPKCKLILVENKEESVNRALMRSRYLNNISIYQVCLKFHDMMLSRQIDYNWTSLQCNLDYFKGNFDFGIGLHACGVATDLIIERCLGVKASFVVCSCCYGSMKNTQHISYPRSKDFLDAGISSKVTTFYLQAFIKNNLKILCKQTEISQTVLNYFYVNLNIPCHVVDYRTLEVFLSKAWLH